MDLLITVFVLAGAGLLVWKTNSIHACQERNRYGAVRDKKGKLIGMKKKR